MIVCEESLVHAVRAFTANAKLPRPENWSTTRDMFILQRCIAPALLSALEQIEEVQLCAGFSLVTVNELLESYDGADKSIVNSALEYLRSNAS